MQAGSGREPEEVQPPRGDIFTQRPGADVEACGRQRVEQFGVDEVHLPQVRLCRVGADPRAVLDGPARVHVAFNAQPSEQADTGLRRFAKGMCCTRTYAYNPPGPVHLKTF